MSSWSNHRLNVTTEMPYLEAIVKSTEGSYPSPEKISKILDHLYLGSQKGAEDIEQLKQLGITHVVNSVDGHHYATTCKKFYLEDFKYLGFKADDVYDYPIMKHFKVVYKFIEDARISGELGPKVHPVQLTPSKKIPARIPRWNCLFFSEAPRSIFSE